MPEWKMPPERRKELWESFISINDDGTPFFEDEATLADALDDLDAAHAEIERMKELIRLAIHGLYLSPTCEDEINEIKCKLSEEGID